MILFLIWLSVVRGMQCLWLNLKQKSLNEDLMLGAVLFAHQNMQVVIENCLKLKELVGNADWEIEEEP